VTLLSREYNKYLQEHKTNVGNAFMWIQDNLPELLKDDYERQICADHDQSKSNEDEYYAYESYFYGNNISFEIEQAFNKAWLVHIHKNPHHWQHWILVNDDPKDGDTILDIPYNYIIEMICDWWSFSFKSNDLYTIFDWYANHKSIMKLSSNTKSQVEYILGQIYKKLDEL